jgi:hypothetical protein
VASPAVNKLKTVGNQQDNYMLTKESGAQKRTRTSTSIRTLAPEASASTIPPPGHRCVGRGCKRAFVMCQTDSARVWQWNWGQINHNL